MKKILFTTVSALALAAFADGVNSTEFGILTVPSSAAQTIVSVPWLESGTGDSAVTVSNLVLTAGLHVGDELKYYKGVEGGKAQYDCWVIAEKTVTVEGEEKKILYWTPGVSVTGDNKVETAAAANDATIPRGKAVILNRYTTHGPIASTFSIMGKPSSSSGNVTLGPGYSLIAPPSVTATDVNTLTWTGINGKTDALIIPKDEGGFKTLTYREDDGWSLWKSDPGEWSTKSEDVSIDYGKGAWFKNGGTADKEVSW